MKRSAAILEAIEDQAAVWLMRQDRGLTAAEKAEFERWCAADPRHATSVREISTAWRSFGRPADTGQVDALRNELSALARRDRQRWQMRGAVVLAAACLAVMLAINRPTLTSAPMAGDKVAGKAARLIEPERQTLPDGSTVELRYGARITVAYSEAERVVKLENGEALFSVAKNPRRPFIVKTGAVQVRAVGTAFAVETGPDEVGILVTEGQVRVDSSLYREKGTDGLPQDAQSVLAMPDHAPFVGAGHRAVVALVAAAPISTVVHPVTAVEQAERLSWRLPRFEFSETSIAEAIAMFNRYNPKQLHLGDAGIAGMRITGVFRSDNVDGFVRALETSFDLRVEQSGQELFLHSPR